jgi:hypothetical protein
MTDIGYKLLYGRPTATLKVDTNTTVEVWCTVHDSIKDPIVDKVIDQMWSHVYNQISDNLLLTIRADRR